MTEPTPILPDPSVPPTWLERHEWLIWVVISPAMLGEAFILWGAFH